jgi:hypothetical protein
MKILILLPISYSYIKLNEVGEDICEKKNFIMIDMIFCLFVELKFNINFIY